MEKPSLWHIFDGFEFIHFRMKTISFRIHSNFADKWIAVWGKLNPFTNTFWHKSSRLKVIVHKQRNWNCTGTKLTIRTTLLLFRWQPWIPPSHTLPFAQRTHNRISVACNSFVEQIIRNEINCVVRIQSPFSRVERVPKWNGNLPPLHRNILSLLMYSDNQFHLIDPAVLLGTCILLWSVYF